MLEVRCYCNLKLRNDNVIFTITNLVFIIIIIIIKGIFLWIHSFPQPNAMCMCIYVSVRIVHRTVVSTCKIYLNGLI
jgi:hypothetical protein